MQLKACNSPSNDLVHLNRVYVNSSDMPPNKHVRVTCSPGGGRQPTTLVYSVEEHPKIDPGHIGLNKMQRTSLSCSPEDVLGVEGCNPERSLTSLTIMLELNTRTTGVVIDATQLGQLFKERYGNQVFSLHQQLFFDLYGRMLRVRIQDAEAVDKQTGQQANVSMGEVLADTVIIPKCDPIIKLTNMPATATKVGDMFKKDFNFETLGIGGLSEEFGNIFRRAFASRVFPASVVERLGINHVKGILLHGPPGTGKTLMARQIGKMLNCHEPKVVNGPEVMNKYVGQTEENIRNLFADAEAEQAEKGDESGLHLLIFDEIDAICKQRGSSRDSTGVHDSMVNQLLSKIDGVEALNNVLLIGMTNRKDMLDEALLRPGRFEVQIEIGLPDEAGRLEIFKIHTTKIRKNKFMDESIDLNELAKRARNYTGAEIEGIVKSAVSYAFAREVDVGDMKKTPDPDNIKVTLEDFMRAMDEVKPALGAEEDALTDYCGIDGAALHAYGSRWTQLQSTVGLIVGQLRESSTPMLTLLVHGERGVGKTALAALAAQQSGFPYIKLVTAESTVGYSEMGKAALIRKAFDNAYKSPLSVLVLDDLERLIEYVSIGPRFSNTILQTLLVLIRQRPPPGKKLLVIGTSSNTDVLEHLEFKDTFQASVEMEQLSPDEGLLVAEAAGYSFAGGHDAARALLPRHLGIKKLLLVFEMASQGAKVLQQDKLRDALALCGCSPGL